MKHKKKKTYHFTPGQSPGTPVRHGDAISHIRRLLDTDFASDRLDKSCGHFAGGMRRVEDHMNSKGSDAGGGGLRGLADDLRERCQQVVDSGGERLPH